MYIVGGVYIPSNYPVQFYIIYTSYVQNLVITYDNQNFIVHGNFSMSAVN